MWEEFRQYVSERLCAIGAKDIEDASTARIMLKPYQPDQLRREASFLPTSRSLLSSFKKLWSSHSDMLGS
jgi:hypothetical protein